MPPTADPTIRNRLVAATTHLLDTGEEVSLRKVTQAAGTSTMAVYTHFDGMPGLWRAVREQGFSRLAERLRDLDATDDPVADMVAAGAAYVTFALEEPSLYRALFDLREGTSQPATAGATFAVLVEAVQRSQDSGRLHARFDPVETATRLWTCTHGVVSLILTHALPPDAADQHLPSVFTALVRDLGDGPRRSTRSVARGWARIRPPDH